MGGSILLHTLGSHWSLAEGEVLGSNILLQNRESPRFVQTHTASMDKRAAGHGKKPTGAHLSFSFTRAPLDGLKHFQVFTERTTWKPDLDPGDLRRLSPLHDDGGSHRVKVTIGR